MIWISHNATAFESLSASVSNDKDRLSKEKDQTTLFNRSSSWSLWCRLVIGTIRSLSKSISWNMLVFWRV